MFTRKMNLYEKTKKAFKSLKSKFYHCKRRPIIFFRPPPAYGYGRYPMEVPPLQMPRGKNSST